MQMKLQDIVSFPKVEFDVFQCKEEVVVPPQDRKPPKYPYIGLNDANGWPIEHGMGLVTKDGDIYIVIYLAPNYWAYSPREKRASLMTLLVAKNSYFVTHPLVFGLSLDAFEAQAKEILNSNGVNPK